MNASRILLCLFLLCLLPQACLAQKYYSDDGQYVAEIERIKQVPWQTDETWIDVRMFLYVHQVTDKTPLKKVSPLRQDRLVEADIDTIITGNEPLSPPQYDENGGNAHGDRSEISLAMSVGKARSILPLIDFTVGIVTSPKWNYLRKEIPEGAHTTAFGPIMYQTTTDTEGFHVTTQSEEPDPLRGELPDVYRLNWENRFYGQQYLTIVDAKHHPLYLTGGLGVTGMGNFFTGDYNLDRNQFFRRDTAKHKSINYPVTISLPMPGEWTFKTEHFHLTNIPLPPVTHDY